MSELRLLLRKSVLNGQPVVAPASKSYTQRALVAAALASGKTRVKNGLLADDTEATIEALQKLGATIVQREDEIEVRGPVSAKGKKVELHCRESGATLRFLIPLCALLDREIELTGKEGLLKRPTREVVRALANAGARVEDRNGVSPVKTKGGLRGGKIKIRGDISSQFISGLLFALPLAENDSEVEITGDVESQPYIDMTIDVLTAFGIRIGRSPDGKHYQIPGRQTYRAVEAYRVEGDYSSAAFLLAAGILAGSEVELKGVPAKTRQGDSAIISLVKQMGAHIVQQGNSVRTKKSTLRAIDIDVRDTPDLVPILAVIATQAKGTTRITNAGRLRIKESDRLSAITQELRKMGANIVEKPDSLGITGPTSLHGAIVDPHGDHRIAMACAVAGLVAEGETMLMHPEVVKKSYPDFFYHLRKLGATILSETAAVGERFRTELYGGSHEKCVGVRIRGVPPGTEISMDGIRAELEKRKPVGRLTTPRREKDECTLVQGIHDGRATGEPIVFEIENKDVDSRPYEAARYTPRPNHGDYTTAIKYGGVFDFRGGGFLSARMTVGTVIAGAIAKQMLARKGIRLAAYVKQIGKIRMERLPSLDEAEDNTYRSEVRCPDRTVSQAMAEAVDKARSEQDSLGGIIECQVHGLPVGIGEPIFHAVDSVLAHYLFSIPAVKGVEFGAGFEVASRKGSENNDPFELRDGQIVTTTNNSGGILGGITNGMPLVCRVAIKPTSSIAKEQATVDTKKRTGTTLRVLGRHDPCVAIRAPVIVETTVAIGILDLLLRSGIAETK